MNANVKTTGQFREFLASVMDMVRTDKIGTSQATQIAKLAEQVNENFYVELVVAQKTGNVRFGEHPIGAVRKS